LSFLTGLLRARGAQAVEICTLFDRVRRRIVPVPVAYRGCEVGDEYLVGYGLGIGGLYRHLPDVYAVPPAL
jgi:hypoxanthine phosphoribosyltransferase